MTKVAYIAPSALPSRAANGVHVALQCEGLARLGAEVTLYTKRNVPRATDFPAALEDAYGIDAAKLELVSFHSRFSRADTLRIASLACSQVPRARPDVILSRNLYAAWWLGAVKKMPMLFETHQLEIGFRKKLQRAAMGAPNVTTVVISDALACLLAEHHAAAPRRVVVAHDAAREGMATIAPAERRAWLTSRFPALAGDWSMACGYFGQLHAGRGIEIIESLARMRPNVLFATFGGSEAEVRARRAANPLANLHFLGHIPHPVAREAMAAFDALLMPYQRSVSIGIAGHDTARWMSPMKMFEYLATGVPVVSSDLPVLREVLRAGENALLAIPEDPASWAVCLDRLAAEPAFARLLGEAARVEYLASGTWTERGRKLLNAAS